MMKQSGLKCPQCGSSRLVVTTTRAKNDTIRRRRECFDCSERFLTEEVIVQRQRNHTVEWRGRKGTVASFAREMGLEPRLVRFRMKERGWSLEQALTTPSRKKVRR